MLEGREEEELEPLAKLGASSLDSGSRSGQSSAWLSTRSWIKGYCNVVSRRDKMVGLGLLLVAVLFLAFWLVRRRSQARAAVGGGPVSIIPKGTNLLSSASFLPSSLLKLLRLESIPGPRTDVEVWLLLLFAALLSPV